MRALVALAEERHFTRAAARLHVAQPALSQQIARLEREAGVPLVDRTTRRVALTEAGELLVAHARRMLAEEELALAELDDLVGVRRGRLSIGASQAMGPVDLGALLVGFHRGYPEVELTVREALSIALNAALQADELDLAFVTTVVDATQIESHEIDSEALVCVLSPTHRLADQATVSVADLADDTFVMFGGSATIRGLVEGVAATHGFTPRVGFETSDVRRIRELVSAGLGVAILPLSDARARGPKVAVAHLSDPGLEHVIHLCWRRGRHHSPAARAFLEHTLGSKVVHT